MKRSRLGLRAIALCLALAALMAIVASSAQTEVGAAWLVEDKKVTTALKAEPQGTLENNHGLVLTEVPSGIGGVVGIHILCTGFTLLKGSVLLENGGWLGQGQFSGCEILQLKKLNDPTSLELLKACTPPGGLITTEFLRGLLTLHKLISETVDTVTVIEPDVGTLMTTITMGEGCPLGFTIKITGKVAVQDTAVGTSQVTHLFTEFAPLTRLFINGKEPKVTFDGSVNVTLAEAHKALKWSGDPA